MSSGVSRLILLFFYLYFCKGLFKDTFCQSRTSRPIKIFISLIHHFRSVLMLEGELHNYRIRTLWPNTLERLLTRQSEKKNKNAGITQGARTAEVLFGIISTLRHDTAGRGSFSTIQVWILRRLWNDFAYISQTRGRSPSPQPCQHIFTQSKWGFDSGTSQALAFC